MKFPLYLLTVSCASTSTGYDVFCDQVCSTLTDCQTSTCISYSDPVLGVGSCSSLFLSDRNGIYIEYISNEDATLSPLEVLPCELAAELSKAPKLIGNYLMDAPEAPKLPLETKMGYLRSTLSNPIIQAIAVNMALRVGFSIASFLAASQGQCFSREGCAYYTGLFLRLGYTELSKTLIHQSTKWIW